MEKTRDVKVKKLGLIIAIVAVVALVAGILAFTLLGKAPDTVYEFQPYLYWNVDRYNNVNSKTGLSTRTPYSDGTYNVRFFVDGEMVELPILDVALVNRLDTMDAVCLKLDADGVIIEIGDPELLYTKVQDNVYVEKVDGNTVHLNSSIDMKGSQSTLTLTDDANIYNVMPRSEDLGKKCKLEIMDRITVFTSADGAQTYVFMSARERVNSVFAANKAPADVDRRFTSREPDENGVYWFELMVDGIVGQFKTKSKEVATAVDSFGKMPFAIEVDGDVILGAYNVLDCPAIHEAAFNGFYDVIKVEDGKLYLKRNQPGLEDTGSEIDIALPSEAVFYNIDPTTTGEWGVKDEIQAGDRVYGYLSPSGEFSVGVIMYECTREDGGYGKCEHCDEIVWWENFSACVVPDTSAHYYVANDMDLREYYKFDKLDPFKKGLDFVIDLNGKTITLNPKGGIIESPFIYVGGLNSMLITDYSGGKVGTVKSTEEGGRCSSYAAFLQYAGSSTAVIDKGNFDISTIAADSAGAAGGIFSGDGTLTINSGTYRGFKTIAGTRQIDNAATGGYRKASGAGGVVGGWSKSSIVINGGTFYASPSEIENNKASGNGGIVMANGNLTITGGEFIGPGKNDSKKVASGGLVYCSGQTLSITGGRFYNGYGTGYGFNVAYIRNSGICTIGGNAYINGGFTISSSNPDTPVNLRMKDNAVIDYTDNPLKQELNVRMRNVKVYMEDNVRPSFTSEEKFVNYSILKDCCGNYGKVVEGPYNKIFHYYNSNDICTACGRGRYEAMDWTKSNSLPTYGYWRLTKDVVVSKTYKIQDETYIDLNGFDIIYKSDEEEVGNVPLRVRKDAKLIIDDTSEGALGTVRAEYTAPNAVLMNGSALIHAEGEGEFELRNGTVDVSNITSAYTAAGGGAIVASNKAKVVIEGGVVKGFKSFAGSGGAIGGWGNSEIVINGGTFYPGAGKITEKEDGTTSVSGYGGVVFSNGTLTITGGEFIGPGKDDSKRVFNGGLIYSQGTDLTITGGSIHSGNGVGYGANIYYIRTEGNLTIGGDAFINGGLTVASYIDDRPVNMRIQGTPTIDHTGANPDSGVNLRLHRVKVYLNDDETETLYTIAGGADRDYSLIQDCQGKVIGLQKGNVNIKGHNYGDDDICIVCGYDKNKVEKWTKTDSLPTEGNWKLAANVTVTQNTTVTGDLRIDLNGKNITLKSDDVEVKTVLYTVPAYRKLTIDDTSAGAQGTVGVNYTAKNAICATAPALIYVKGYGEFVLQNGTVDVSNISCNYTNAGGGAIIAGNNGKVTIEGGVVKGFKSFEGQGGAIGGWSSSEIVINGGTFYPGAGKITVNEDGTTSVKGDGGVIFSNGKLTITGGEFIGPGKDDSKRVFHGGLILSYGTDLTITGGSFKNGNGVGYGANIYYARTEGNLTIGGDAFINGGLTVTSYDDNRPVNMRIQGTPTIDHVGAEPDSGCNLRLYRVKVYLNDDETETLYTIAGGADRDYALIQDCQGKVIGLQKGNVTIKGHNYGDDDICTVCGNDKNHFDTWTKTDSLPTEGSWKLAANVTVTENTTVTGDLRIDLNGKNITLKSDDVEVKTVLYTVPAYRTLTIDDTSAGEKGTVGVNYTAENAVCATSPALIYVKGNAEFVLKNGTIDVSNISCNYTNAGGGAIVAGNNGKVTIEGGVVKGFKSFEGQGGAIGGWSSSEIVINGGTFHSGAGKITVNEDGTTSVKGDGGVIFSNGKLTITGGEFIGPGNDDSKRVFHGGLILSYGTDLTITGGSFKNGNGVGYGANIYYARTEGNLTIGGDAFINGGLTVTSYDDNRPVNMRIQGTPTIDHVGAEPDSGCNLRLYRVKVYLNNDEAETLYTIAGGADRDYALIQDCQGKVIGLQKGNVTIKSHNYGDDDICTVCGNDKNHFDTWTKTDSLPTEGSWKLAANVTVTENTTVTGDLRIDLNGKNITLKSDDVEVKTVLYTVPAYRTLTIDDTSAGAKGTVGVNYTAENAVCATSPALIYVKGYGEFVLQNGTIDVSNISCNYTNAGGGAIVAGNNGKVTIEGGVVKGFKTFEGQGGAIGGWSDSEIVINGGTFYPGAGKITENADETVTINGNGGVVFSNGKLTITGGEFIGPGNDNSKRVFHGGLILSYGPELTITGGSFRNGFGAGYGANIYYARTEGNLTIGGDAFINGGLTVTSYFDDRPVNMRIQGTPTIDRANADPNPGCNLRLYRVKVYLNDDTTETLYTIAEGVDRDYALVVDCQGKVIGLEKGNATIAGHNYGDDDICDVCGINRDVAEGWTDSNALPTSGTYKLSTDVNVTASTRLTGPLVLDLNGHTVTRTVSDEEEEAYVIHQNGYALTIRDTSTEQNGTMKMVPVTAGKVFTSLISIIYDNNIFTLEGGILDNTAMTSSYATAMSGAVTVSNTFIMNGGVIKGQKNISEMEAATGSAIGMRSNTRVTINGGKIYGWKDPAEVEAGKTGKNLTAASRAGTVINAGAGSIITINGGELHGSRASYIGGVIRTVGDLTVNGGKIINGYADTHGGLVYSTGNITITGGEFSGGYALNASGGIYCTGETEMVISGGTIKNNANHDANAAKGNNVLKDKGTLTITGGTIGGGVGISGANVKMVINGKPVIGEIEGTLYRADLLIAGTTGSIHLGSADSVAVQTAEGKYEVVTDEQGNVVDVVEFGLRKWTDGTSLPTSGVYKLTTNVAVSADTRLDGELILDLNGYTITRTVAADVTDAFVIHQNGQKLTIRDSSETKTGTIKMVPATEGTVYSGVIAAVYANNLFTLDGGTIDNTAMTTSYATAMSGAVTVSNTFVMNGGVIKGQKNTSEQDAATGSAIGMRSNTRVTINGGKIYGWKDPAEVAEGKTGKNLTAASRAGTVINAGAGSIITINGGELHGSRASYIGGVIRTVGDLTVNGGKIINGYADTHGGLVYSTGNITITGGEFSGGYAFNASGGIYCTGETEMVISGGTIKNNVNDNNWSGRGNNIIKDKGTLIISGGTIGGGIGVAGTNGKMVLTGKPVIGKIEGTLYRADLLISSSTGSIHIGSADSEAVKTAEGKYEVVTDEDGNIVDVIEYLDKWTDGTSLPTSGIYKLTTNVAVSADTRLEGELILDLNGYTITRTVAADVTDAFVIHQNGQKLTIKDSSAAKTGTIKMVPATEGAVYSSVIAAVYVNNLFILDGGTIDNTAMTTSYATAMSGAVTVSNTFIMNGGVIKGQKNTSEQEAATGSAIGMRSNARVTINGGKIYGWKDPAEVEAGKTGKNLTAASRAGTVINAGAGSIITINGGELHGSRASYIGGVIRTVGDLTVNGGKIINGYADTHGGLVYSTGNITITGGEFSGGYAHNASGGIYCTGVTEMVISGGTIKNNANSSANATKGNNIIKDKGTLTISGGTIGGGIGISGTNVKMVLSGKPVIGEIEGTLYRADLMNTSSTGSIHIGSADSEAVATEATNYNVVTNAEGTVTGVEIKLMSWTTEDALPTSGYHKLDTDVAVSANTELTGNLVLDLNGHTITRTVATGVNEAYVLRDMAYALTIRDSSEAKTGLIKMVHEVPGTVCTSQVAAIEVKGTTTVDGGTIDNTGMISSYANAHFGAITINGGAFVMNDGVIKGQKSGSESTYASSVIGVRNSTSGSVTINGGKLYVWKDPAEVEAGKTGSGLTAACNRGGVINAIGGNITINGGELYGANVTTHGGIIFTAGNVYINGGLITDGYAYNNCGGILCSGTEMIITGGTIKNNSNANANAAKGYNVVKDKGTLTISGGTIGGGIGIAGNGGKMVLTGKPVIGQIEGTLYRADLLISADNCSIHIGSADSEAVQTAQGKYEVVTDASGSVVDVIKHLDKWTDGTSLPTSGAYKLTTNVAVSANTELTGDLILDLNGHTITRTVNTGVNEAYVFRDATHALTIRDRSADKTGLIQMVHQVPGTVCTSQIAAVEVKGTTTLDGGTIDNTGMISSYTGAQSGAITINGGAFVMNGGVVKGQRNSSSDSKGGSVIGMRTVTTGSVTINGGKLYAWKDPAEVEAGKTGASLTAACNRGGVINAVGGNITINGGELHGAHATTHGGIIYTAGNVYINGGLIADGYTYNTAGGVYCSGTEMIITGGTIKNNSNANASATKAYNVAKDKGTLTISGGTIGGGIGISGNGGKMVITGKPVIGEIEGTLYRADLLISGANASIHIDSKDNAAVATGEGKYVVVTNAEGTVTGVERMLEAWTTNDALPTSGHYKLTTNVAVSANTELTGDLVIDLNGFTITRTVNTGVNEAYVFRDMTYALTIRDRSADKTGLIQMIHQVPGTVCTSQIAAVEVKGTTTLDGGTIDNTGMISSYGNAHSGAITINGGAFVMNGGVIKGQKNTSGAANGGSVIGVRTSTAGSVTINGGKLYAWKDPAEVEAGKTGSSLTAACNRGGVINAFGGNITINGGELYGANVTTHGGIIFTAGNVYINGGLITDGYAYNNCGGILCSGTEMIITGGTIKNNSNANANAAKGYNVVKDKGTLTISGGTIGGGIGIAGNGGKMVITGKPVIGQIEGTLYRADLLISADNCSIHIDSADNEAVQTAQGKYVVVTNSEGTVTGVEKMMEAWTTNNALPTSGSYRLTTDVNVVSNATTQGTVLTGNLVLDLNGHTITRTLEDGTGEAYVYRTGEYELTIRDSSAEKTGLIKMVGAAPTSQVAAVEVKGKFTLDGGTIDNSAIVSVYAGAQSGAITINGGAFVMNDGVIKGQRNSSSSTYASSVIGIRNSAAGSVEINGGKLYAWKDPAEVEAGKTGASLTAACNRGAVINAIGGNITINGGELYGAHASVHGGIIFTAGNVYINGGLITDGYAGNASGGVYCSGTEMIITGGTIKNNSNSSANAAKGYNVVKDKGTLTISGGTIGGGIGIAGNGGKMILTGKPVIGQIEGTLYRADLLISADNCSIHIGSADSAAVQTAQGKYVVVTNAEGTVTGVEKMMDAWTTNDALPTSGTYKLTTDVAVSATTALSGDLVLDLNGYTVTRTVANDVATDEYVFALETKALTIRDSSVNKTGTIKMVPATEGTVYAGNISAVYANGTFTLDGGTLDNTAMISSYTTAPCGTVTVSGVFTMNGGVIKGQKHTSTSSGVGGSAIGAHTTGVITINGGKLYGWKNPAEVEAGKTGSQLTAACATGSVINGGKKITINGGELYGSHAANHGGVIYTSANVYINGGLITDGYSYNNCGGILCSGTEMIITGGTIKNNANNSANAAKGYNVVKDKGTLTISGGTIGGGIGIAGNGGKMVITGKPVIGEIEGTLYRADLLISAAGCEIYVDSLDNAPVASAVATYKVVTDTEGKVTGVTVIAESWTKNNELPTSGIYKLDTDVSVVSNATTQGTALTGNLVLDLNGHTITRTLEAGTGEAYVYRTGAYELTVRDDSAEKTGLIKMEGAAPTSQVAAVEVKGKFTLDGGTIDNTAIVSAYSGAQSGAITINGGAFVMNDGVIKGQRNSTSDSKGGSVIGVRNSTDGSVTINGGKLYAWKNPAEVEAGKTGSSLTAACNRGGVINAVGGNITINGGELHGAHATTHGGIIYTAGNVYINGGLIADGYTYNTAGGVYCSGTEMIITGGTIKNNSNNSASATKAYNVAKDKGTLTISGGTIGGGIGISGNGGKMVITGKPVIGAIEGTLYRTDLLISSANCAIYIDSVDNTAVATAQGNYKVVYNDEGVVTGVTTQ